MIGTSYFDVYKRAITEFNDPVLQNMLKEKTILFSETMYNFLVNAISLFTAPPEAAIRLQDRSNPVLSTETFECDGETNTFILQNPPDDNLVDESIFEFFVDGIKTDGEYNSITKTITLNAIPDEGSTVTSEIYYIGNFNNNLYDEEIYILSQFIVACWSEFITNDKLDIIRLLGDTDFKLSSNSSTTTSKVAWNTTTMERVTKKMSKYAWDCRYRRTY